MKATELRVGNLVKAKHTNGNPKKWVVIQIKPEHIVTCSDKPKWFKPIPLTEEWFLKFPKINWLLKDIDGHFLWFKGDKIYIKFVHSLQNIYFCIYEKEAILKH